MFDATSLLNTARSHHQRGQIAEAERLYRQVLSQEPQNAEALTLLGGACIGLGRPAEAAEILSEACRLSPRHAPAHDNLGVALAKLNRYAEAAKAFEQATRLNPEYVGTWVNLGNALVKQGKLLEAIAPLEQAVHRDPNSAWANFELAGALLKLGRNEPAAACYARAIQLKPGNAVAHFYRGTALSALRRHDEARACYERALMLIPDHPETLVNLGSVLTALGRHAEAIERLQRAVALRHDLVEAHINLGNALTAAGQYDAAAAELRLAARLNPNSSEAYNNLGNVLIKQFQYSEAVAAFQQAVRLKPDDPEPHYNLGNTYYRLREPRRAIAEVNEALRLRPNYPEARHTRAVASLLLGDFAAGWADYESRWQCPEFKPRKYAQPMWDGSPLAGKRILLFAEQGLGDTLQMIRYVRPIKQLGGHTIVEIQRPLLKLLSGIPGVDELRPLDANTADFDVYAPLMSLPRILAADERTIPAETPYLYAPQVRVEHWRQKLSELHGLKVGLAWQGNPSYPDDRLRSIPLGEFEPLAELSNLSFVILQKGPGSEQLDALADRFPIRGLGSDFDESAGPFVDTAAVMMNLDLIVSSDTAVAHLAGALGRPVWVLLPYAPDWRWMLERTDTPWYPTMRLFRQPAMGQWPPVVADVVAALGDLAKSRSG